MPFYFFITLLLLKISVAILQVFVLHDVAEIPKPTADLCWRMLSWFHDSYILCWKTCWNFVHVLRENAAETLQKDAESFIGERVRHFNVIFSVLVSFFSLKNISSGHSEMDRVAWFSCEGMTLAILNNLDLSIAPFQFRCRIGHGQKISNLHRVAECWCK